MDEAVRRALVDSHEDMLRFLIGCMRARPEAEEVLQRFMLSASSCVGNVIFAICFSLVILRMLCRLRIVIFWHLVSCRMRRSDVRLLLTRSLFPRIVNVILRSFNFWAVW